MICPIPALSHAVPFRPPRCCSDVLLAGLPAPDAGDG